MHPWFHFWTTVHHLLVPLVLTGVIMSAAHATLDDPNNVGWLSKAMGKAMEWIWPYRCGFVREGRLILISRRVVTPEGVQAAAVCIDDGKIEGVVPFTTVDLNSSTMVIDYGNAVISPGIVDTHVHLNEPGREDWEGMVSGTKSAAAGGVTTVIDMPLNSSPPSVTYSEIRQKLLMFKDKTFVNYGAWGGLVPNNARSSGVLTKMIENGALGLKVFLSPSGLDDFPQTQKLGVLAALHTLMKYGVPLYVHAEIPTEVDVVGNGESYQTYLSSRPPKFEKDAIEMLIDALGKLEHINYKRGFRIHVAHLSDAGSLEMIKKARLRGLPISVETCPHYLKFASEEIRKHATEFKCAPPIRSRENNNQLWKAVLDGDINMISSDHSPSPPSLKDGGDFLTAWGGISGLQYTLPAVWSAAEGRKLSLTRAAELLSGKPAKLANLHRSKGVIKAGYDADLMVWDPDEMADTSEAGCYHKHKLSPYRDLEMKGRVLATWVQGRLVFSKGRGVAKKPCGRVIGLGSWAKWSWFSNLQNN